MQRKALPSGNALAGVRNGSIQSVDRRCTATYRDDDGTNDEVENLLDHAVGRSQQGIEDRGDAKSERAIPPEAECQDRAEYQRPGGERTQTDHRARCDPGKRLHVSRYGQEGRVVLIVCADDGAGKGDRGHQ